MNKLALIGVFFAALLLVPPNAFSQSIGDINVGGTDTSSSSASDRIVILDNLGTYQKGDSLFVYGQVATLEHGAYLIMQIVNPYGNFCQIQQLSPLSNGVFSTDPIALSGNICGIEGDYSIRLFYDDYKKTSSFTVSTQDGIVSLSDNQLVNNAKMVIQEKISFVQRESQSRLDSYTQRLNSSSNDLTALETLYVDLWDHFTIDDAIYEISPVFRPSVLSAIEFNNRLLDTGDIDLELSKQIERHVYASIFHYEIGNKNQAILGINDVFVQIQNADPVKAPESSRITFSDLESALLVLMKKTGTVMSSFVKEEIAFIFARGTAPLFSADITNLVDLLSKTRYLDVVSRKDTSLYNVVNVRWESLRGSLTGQETIEDLLSSKNRVDKLHSAALLLRQLDRVDRFISSDEEANSELANIIKPRWDALESRLESASTVDSILDARDDIEAMKSVIDISHRISKSVDIALSIDSNSVYARDWRSLLDSVQSAGSVEDILLVVTEFDRSISDLRNKRDPLVSLRFEYEQLKLKAELQADYKNLEAIKQALRVIYAAQQMENGVTLTASKIDRSEILLHWASQNAPVIRQELETSSEADLRAKASDILQRAKSIENLIDISMTKNRFLPGFTDFTSSMKERIEVVRDLVIRNDLKAADTMVQDLFDEWMTVSSRYTDDPLGSEKGYSLDEIQRITYREQLEEYANIISTFRNADFDSHAVGYRNLVDSAYRLIEYGNFVDLDKKMEEIGNYIEKYLPLSNPRLIFDIDYDHEGKIWTLSGFIDKQTDKRRENLYLQVYDADGSKHSNLDFTDTRQGEFFTKWHAPASPGLYVVVLRYQDIQASQVVHIPETQKYQERPSDGALVDLARKFEELRLFMERFGGSKYAGNSKILSTVGDIESALSSRHDGVARQKLDTLEYLIERYLPNRDRTAVVEVQLDDAKRNLTITGAVEKSLAFSEDLYIDIFDQRGDIVQSITLKDNSRGLFSNTVPAPSASGVYVAQLEYHDLQVTDFFVIP